MAAVGHQVYLNPSFFQQPPPIIDFNQPPPSLNSYPSQANDQQHHHHHHQHHSSGSSHSHGHSHHGQSGGGGVSHGASSSKAGISGANMPPGMDARRMRKAVFRRTIDYNTPIMRYMNQRLWQVNSRDRWVIQPDYLYQAQLEPPMSYLDNPMNCVTTKHVRTSTNKNKCPVYCVCWTPEGRRLITGAYSGEFTLWNGLTFNFETILQAHETQIRCMKWSHNEDWLLTADHSGYVKYWQANMNNVEMFQAHKEPIRGVSFCPSDDKFVTCCDDSTVRIWDFYQCTEERVLRGHGADVRCVAWHPYKSLIISGSKDAQQPIKLWAPRTGESIATLYVHKNTCTDVSWNKNGNWFLTASRDHLIKLFDVRNLKTEMQTFRGHKRDVMRVAWHPFHESLFVSGSADGAIMYWMVGTDMEVGSVEDAHENMIWSLAWHPLGHILVSGANDFATKFWTRNRPGDQLKETTGGGASRGSANAASNSAGGHEEEPSGGGTLTNSLLLEDDDLEDDNFQNLDQSEGIDSSTLAGQHSLGESLLQAVIPGLNDGAVQDLNVEEEDSEEREKAKARAIKSIPRQFATNWASARLAAMPALLPNNVRPMQPMTGPVPVNPTPNQQQAQQQQMQPPMGGMMQGGPMGGPHVMMRMPLQRHQEQDGFMPGPHVRPGDPMGSGPQVKMPMRPDSGQLQRSGPGIPVNSSQGLPQFRGGPPSRFPSSSGPGRMPPPPPVSNSQQQDSGEDHHPGGYHQDDDDSYDDGNYDQPPQQQHFSGPPRHNFPPQPRGPPFRGPGGPQMPPNQQRSGFSQPPNQQRGPPRGNFPPRGPPFGQRGGPPFSGGPSRGGPPRFPGGPMGYPSNGPAPKRPRGPMPWRGGGPEGW